MKIVFGSDQYWPSMSGVSVSIDIFKHELETKGHQVFLFVPKYKKQIIEENNNIFRFKSKNIMFNDENRLVLKSETKKIYNSLDKIKPDIIHIHTEFSMFKILSKYALKRKIPLIITIHTNWSDLIKDYIPFITKKIGDFLIKNILCKRYNQTTAIIVPSLQMKNILLKQTIYPPIHIISTGIDKKMIQPKKVKKNSLMITQYPLLKNKTILLYVGRIAKEKNITFLIDSLVILIETNPNIVLLIVGDGPFKSELEQYISKKEITQHVVFTGYIERNKLIEFYSASKVFVFASKVETQGMVILEAMASKLPVVAIGEMGTKEIMFNENLGGFLSNDSVIEFSEKINQLLNNNELYLEKCKETDSIVVKWSIDSFIFKLIDLYKSLI